MGTRRKFLEKITVSTVGLSLLPYPNPVFAVAEKPCGGPMLKVALMGLGSYASRVAEAMQDCKRAEITGLISGTPSKLKEWGSKYDVPKERRYNYENFDAIKDNPEIDAVYIITPNGLHADQTKRVAQAGKHVICEKPMGVNADEGRAMVEACRSAGVKLLIGYRMHFEPKTVAVVKMREAGEFGTPKFFQGQSGFVINDPNQWRLDKKLAGGGALLDIGIYAINGARYMIGEEPSWVTAQETKTDPKKFKESVDETIQFQLGFPSGAIANGLSTYNISSLDRFYMTGTEGFVELQPSTGYGPIEGRTHKGKLNQKHVTHQTLQMDGMASIIFDGKQPAVPVDGEEGLKDMKIIDAIYKAIESGEKVMIAD